MLIFLIYFLFNFYQEIVANKVVPGYWEKCFVSEPTPLKFFSDLEFRDWKLKKEKNGVNPYDQVILVDVRIFYNLFVLYVSGIIDVIYYVI